MFILCIIISHHLLTFGSCYIHQRVIHSGDSWSIRGEIQCKLKAQGSDAAQVIEAFRAAPVNKYSEDHVIS